MSGGHSRPPSYSAPASEPMRPVVEWSGLQLAEFLSGVSAYPDEQSALDGAMQLAAAAVAAEASAVLRDGAVIAALGFPPGRPPLASLLAAAAGRRTTVHVAGLGDCPVQVVWLEEAVPTALVVARHGGGFTAEEKTQLHDMGRVLMLAVAPLRLLEVERALRHQSELQAEEHSRLLALLRQRQTFLERLHAIQRAISHRSPVQTVFDAIAEGAAEVLHDDIGALRLVDDDDPGFVRLVAAWGLSADVLPSLRRTPLDSGVGGRAVREERLVVSSDYLGMTNALPAVAADGVRAAMAAPVYRDGKVAGSLVVASRTLREYAGEEQEVMLAFAEHASLALNDASALESMGKAYDDAVYQANHDALTGLPNRPLVLDRLGHALDRSVRSGPAVVVLFADLDRFKAVNDSFGHAVGDEVLIRVAAHLCAAVRPGDTVGRLAGDEFVVLCEDLDPLEAVHLAERVADAIAAPLELDGRSVVLTASVGLVIADGRRGPDEVLRDADVAMYRAKQRGRSRIELFDEQMRTCLLERLETEHALSMAVSHDELVVHYQPIVDICSGRVLGVEALVRWNRPGVGLVPPDQFIPIAEEAGLIVPIGRWVLDQACAQVAAWRARGGEVGELQLSVNLSARQFCDPALAEVVAAALALTNLPADALALEITESVLMEDVQATGDTLQALKRLGVRLSVDDFGTGYSSLSYLKRFSVSELKIDRSFVDGLGTDAEDHAIVRAVLGLADALGLDVVAEGVETAVQLHTLATLGCHAAQGYLLGRPQPAATIEERLLSPRLHRCAN